MKIPAKGIVRTYELTYLLPVSYTETELQGFRAEVEKMLAKHKATIVTTEEWGKKKLAYEVAFKHQPQSEAVYVHITFTAKPESIKGIEADLTLNVSLMRYLLVTAEEQKEVSVKAKTNKVKSEKTVAQAE